MPHSVHGDSGDTSLSNDDRDESHTPPNPSTPANTTPPDDQVVTLNDQILQWMQWQPIAEYNGPSEFPHSYGLSCWSNQCPTPQTSIDRTGYFAGPFSRGSVRHTPFLHPWCHRRIYPSPPASPRDTSHTVSPNASLINGINELRVEDPESDGYSEGAEEETGSPMDGVGGRETSSQGG